MRGALLTTAAVLAAVVATPAFAQDPDVAAPDPPALLSPGPGEVAGDPRPVFSWSAVPDAERYELVVDGVGVGTTFDVECMAGSCRTRPDRLLADGDRAWQVRALDAAGNASASEVRFVRVAAPPVGRLQPRPAVVYADDRLVLEAVAADPQRGPLTYAWDTDGDGTYERDTGPVSSLATSWPTVADRSPAVRVTDDAGLSSRFETRVGVRRRPPEGPVGVKVAGGRVAVRSRRVTLTLVWPAFAAGVTVTNDPQGAGTAGLLVAQEVPWTLEERRNPVVLVRFVGSADGSRIYTDRVRLDRRRPRVVSAARVGSRVRVRATDDHTGVVRVQLARVRGRVVATRTLVRNDRLGRRAVVTQVRTRARWVRVLDAAGNASRWRRVG